MNEIKCLNLTVFKYPENKFPHENRIVICYEQYNHIKTTFISAVYPAIKEPEKFNKDYFIFKDMRPGYGSTVYDLDISECKNVSWCYYEDLNMEFICRSCAEKLGGKWSEINDLHHHYSICDGCGRKKSVSHKNDWENLRD